MIAWFAHAPLPLLTLAIFAAMYLSVVLVLVVLWATRRRGTTPGWGRSARG